MINAVVDLDYRCHCRCRYFLFLRLGSRVVGGAPDTYVFRTNQTLENTGLYKPASCTVGYSSSPLSCQFDLGGPPMDQSPPTGSWGKSWFPSGTGKDWSQWRVGDLGCGRLGGAGPLIQAPHLRLFWKRAGFPLELHGKQGPLTFRLPQLPQCGQRLSGGWLGGQPGCASKLPPTSIPRFLLAAMQTCQPAAQPCSLANPSGIDTCMAFGAAFAAFLSRFAAFAPSQVSPTLRPPSTDPRRSRTSRAETPSELRDLNYSATLVRTTPNTERT